VRDSASVSFDAYVVHRSAQLVRLAFVLLGDMSDAEDVVQEALARCYAKWRGLHGDPHAYVRQAVTRRAISLRSQRSASRLRIARHRPAEAHTLAIDAVAEHAVLWPLVLALSPQQRAIIVLLYYEDLPESEVARILGCTINNVKSQRAKALRRLRQATDESDKSWMT
jgi:RNA polymerase sigma-70 factor (sigma-E family)